LRLIDPQLIQDSEEERRADLSTSMDRERRGPAIFVFPTLVTACLARSFKTKFDRRRRNSPTRALGMHDFSGVPWHRLATLAVLFLDQAEDGHQFS
jgi:hypothetical protein